VVLQPAALAELPLAVRPKARTILQSATAPRRRPRPPEDAFQVAVLGHLREVKDPLRTALAARELPRSSHLRVVQAGAALSPEMESAAREEERANPRYRWLGDLPRADALRLLCGSHLLCLTSRLEGGANVVSEAIVCGVPVVSSRIPGSVGLLGEDHPGYFPPGDTHALARLLRRSETDPAFLEELRRRSVERQPLFRPEAEREAWRELLDGLLAT